MEVSPDVPRKPGVFALLHTATAEAYVNETKDLRQRALLWQQRLARGEPGKGEQGIARDFPKYPADEWIFWVCPHDNYAKAREDLQATGWKLLNVYKPRKTYKLTHRDGQLVDGSLAHHCKRAGVKLHTVYKRIDRGMSVEQALGLTDMPPPDKRELAISQMRVQIETDNGGLLTYDEAVMLRPEIGDIREKLKRLRKQKPDMTRVKLSEL